MYITNASDRRECKSFLEGGVALYDKSQPPRLCAKPSNFDYESFKAVEKAGFLVNVYAVFFFVITLNTYLLKK